MTNTENPISASRWVRPGGIPANSTSATRLLRLAAPGTEVTALVRSLQVIRGAHRVEVNERPGELVDGRYVKSGWFSLHFRGTERAVRGALNLLMLSGLEELDVNADHNHERCLAAARAAGVPASYAHRIETYLSS